MFSSLSSRINDVLDCSLKQSVAPGPAKIKWRWGIVCCRIWKFLISSHISFVLLLFLMKGPTMRIEGRTMRCGGVGNPIDI